MNKKKETKIPVLNRHCLHVNAYIKMEVVKGRGEAASSGSFSISVNLFKYSGINFNQIRFLSPKGGAAGERKRRGEVGG